MKCRQLFREILKFYEGPPPEINLFNEKNNGLSVSNLIFEGYLENAYETTLTVVEPTGDRTITLPDSDGQVAMDGDALAYSIVFGS